jgi:hypothetical protein
VKQFLWNGLEGEFLSLPKVNIFSAKYLLCKVIFFPPKFSFQNTKEKFGGKKIILQMNDSSK